MFSLLDIPEMREIAREVEEGGKGEREEKKHMEKE